MLGIFGEVGEIYYICGMLNFNKYFFYEHN